MRVTVAVSTIFSTLVARMVTPMMGAYLLKEKGSGEWGVGSRGGGVIKLFNFKFTLPGRNQGNRKVRTEKRRGFQPYRSLLEWALRHRLTTMAIALAFFIASLTLVPMIPKGFVDDGDFGISNVSIELPPGSTLEDVNKVVTQATNLIRQNPVVERVLATEEINSATLAINLKPREERNISQKQFEEQVRPDFEQIPGARISFQSQSPGGDRKGLSIVLRSENPEALNKAADALEKQMRSLPGLVEVSSTASLVKPEILVIPNPQRAADLGVTVQAIARTASLATIGDNEANLAKFNLSDRQIPIRVQVESGVSRLRPILMTSLATIAGTLPLALGIGAGSEVRQPMGIAIMGGFTTSTLLTLVVVPVIFSYIDNFQNWIKDRLRYGFGKKPSRS
ncbi:acriflavin resistance protein [Nostoc commune NIES-4072]|uniref:Acriflavin resistance protein n=1 Tax=Nostoc commune NIES-4072 TaxID=2005467 RepID=A0A2R5FUJ1_NOSCO|nr:acriflavin resistance protein [Nostoc commune HK-02]GBG19883.1 acriflavin resistance protein [Nostoc commune NIES-4072]